MADLRTKGFFDLQTAVDLLGKLEREFRRMQAAPLDVDHAFNFFVTAEHLLDWLYPGRENRRVREKARTGHYLLALVSHIANGSKHFQAEAAHHQSMGGTTVVHRHDVKLCVVVTAPELAYGSSRMIRPVVDIARMVYEYWKAELSSRARENWS